MRLWAVALPMGLVLLCFACEQAPRGPVELGVASGLVLNPTGAHV